jgi:hypothetical protein
VLLPDVTAFSSLYEGQQRHSIIKIAAIQLKRPLEVVESLAGMSSRAAQQVAA